MATQYLIYPPANAITGIVDTNLVEVSGAAITLGQKTMAASLPVVIASNQSGFPVTQGTTPWVDNVSQFGGSNVVTGTGASGAGIPRVTVSNDSNVLATQSGTWTVQPGNTPNTTPWLSTINQGGNSASVTGANALKVDASASVQPISGAVTANQGTSPWVENISQFGGSNVVTGTGASGAGIPRVTISSDSSLAANQSVNLNQVGGSAITLGQKTSANSAPVVIASDQSSIPVIPGPSTGRSAVVLVRNDYSSVNVTTGAYVQLIASTAATINLLDIFDSSGQTLALATGAVASEVQKTIIYPGGNGKIPLNIASGTRVSIIALSGTANTGELDINFYS